MRKREMLVGVEGRAIRFFGQRLVENSTQALALQGSSTRASRALMGLRSCAYREVTGDYPRRLGLLEYELRLDGVDTGASAYAAQDFYFPVISESFQDSASALIEQSVATSNVSSLVVMFFGAGKGVGSLRLDDVSETSDRSGAWPPYATTALVTLDVGSDGTLASPPPKPCSRRRPCGSYRQT